MPPLVCQKVNAQMKPSDVKIVKFDVTFVKAVRELNVVLIRFSEYDRFHKIINIVVVDILELYGFLLVRISCNILKVLWTLI